MRTLPVERPGSFLPIYGILVGAIQLWLTSTLHGAGRAWMVYDPASPARAIPLLLAALLGLAALGLWIAGWIVARRGRQRINRIALHLCTVVCLAVLYALGVIVGYAAGYL